MVLRLLFSYKFTNKSCQYFKKQHEIPQIASNNADQALLAKIVANFNNQCKTDSVFISSAFSNSFSLLTSFSSSIAQVALNTILKTLQQYSVKVPVIASRFYATNSAAFKELAGRNQVAYATILRYLGN